MKPILDKSPSDPIHARYASPIILRYPPYTNSKQGTMNLLNKVGGVMIGDVLKYALIVVLFLVLIGVY